MKTEITSFNPIKEKSSSKSSNLLYFYQNNKKKLSKGLEVYLLQNQNGPIIFVFRHKKVISSNGDAAYETTELYI